MRIHEGRQPSSEAAAEQAIYLVVQTTADREAGDAYGQRVADVERGSGAIIEAAIESARARHRW